MRKPSVLGRVAALAVLLTVVFNAAAVYGHGGDSDDGGRHHIEGGTSDGDRISEISDKGWPALQQLVDGSIANGTLPSNNDQLTWLEARHFLDAALADNSDSATFWNQAEHVCYINMSNDGVTWTTNSKNHFQRVWDTAWTTPQSEADQKGNLLNNGFVDAFFVQSAPVEDANEVWEENMRDHFMIGSHTFDDGTQGFSYGFPNTANSRFLTNTNTNRADQSVGGGAFRFVPDESYTRDDDDGDKGHSFSPPPVAVAAILTKIKGDWITDYKPGWVHYHWNTAPVNWGEGMYITSDTGWQRTVGVSWPDATWESDTWVNGNLVAKDVPVKGTDEHPYSLYTMFRYAGKPSIKTVIDNIYPNISGLSFANYNASTLFTDPEPTKPPPPTNPDAPIEAGNRYTNMTVGGIGHDAVVDVGRYPKERHGICPKQLVRFWLAVGIQHGWAVGETTVPGNDDDDDLENDRINYWGFERVLYNLTNDIGTSTTAANTRAAFVYKPPIVPGTDETQLDSQLRRCPLSDPTTAHQADDLWGYNKYKQPEGTVRIEPTADAIKTPDAGWDKALWDLRQEDKLFFYAALYKFGCHKGDDGDLYVTGWEKKAEVAFQDEQTAEEPLPYTVIDYRPSWNTDWAFSDVGPKTFWWGLRGDTSGAVDFGEEIFSALGGMFNTFSRFMAGLGMNFGVWVLYLDVLRSNADTVAKFIGGGDEVVGSVTGSGVAGGSGGGWVFRFLIMVLVGWGAWQIVSKRHYGRVTRELVISLVLVIAVGFVADRGTAPFIRWVAEIMSESISLVASLLIQGGGGDDSACVWYYAHLTSNSFKTATDKLQKESGRYILPRNCDHYLAYGDWDDNDKTADTVGLVQDNPEDLTLIKKIDKMTEILGAGSRIYPVMPGTTCLFGDFGLDKDSDEQADLKSRNIVQPSNEGHAIDVTSGGAENKDLRALRRVCPVRYMIKHSLLIEPVNRNNYAISSTSHTNIEGNPKQGWQCATLFDAMAFQHRPSLFGSSENNGQFKADFIAANNLLGCYTDTNATGAGPQTGNDQIEALFNDTIYRLFVARMFDSGITALSSLIGMLFIALVGLYSITGQIMFLVGLLAMPIMGILVVLPGKGRTVFKRWLTVMVRALMMIFASAVLLLLFFYALRLTNVLADSTLGVAWLNRLMYMSIVGVVFWKAWKALNGKVRDWSDKTGAVVDNRLDKIWASKKGDQDKFMKKLADTGNTKWDSASWIKGWRANQKDKMEAGVSKPGDGTLRGSMKGLVGSSKVGKGLRDRTGINIGGDGFKAPTKGKLATPGSRMAGALGKVASGVGKARGKARQGAMAATGIVVDASKTGETGGLWNAMQKATKDHTKTAKTKTVKGIADITERRQNVTERLKHRYQKGTRKKSEQVAANANPAAMRGAKQNREQQNKIMDKINKTGKLGDDRSARELANNLAQSGAGADAIEWGKKTSAQNPQQIAEFKGAAMEATGRLFADEGMSDEDRARATAQNAGLESYSTLAGRSDYTTDDDDDLTAEEASKLAASRNVGDRVRALQSEHVNWAMVDRLAADGALGVRDAVRTQIKGMEINTEEDYQRSQSALHKLNTADRADGVFSSYAAGTLKDRERLAAHDATPADALMEAAKLTVTEPGKYGHNKDVLVALAGHKNSNDQVLEQVWQTAWETDEDDEGTVDAVASVIARRATVGSSVLAEVTERFTQEINNDSISESTQKTVSGFMANRNVDDSYKHSTVDIVSDAYRRNGKDVGGVASGIAQSANAHIASRMSQSVPEAISGMARNPNMSEKSPALTAIMKQDPDSEAANIIRERQDTDTLAQEIITGSGDTVKSAEAILTTRREYEQPDKAGGDPVEVLTERDLSSLDKKQQTALMNKLNTEIDVLADGENSEVVKAAVESAMFYEMANGVEEGHETLADQTVFNEMKQELNKKKTTIKAEEVKLSEERTRSGQFVDTMLESDGYADKQAAEVLKNQRRITNARVAELQEAQQAFESAKAKLSAAEKDQNTPLDRINDLKRGFSDSQRQMKASQNKLAEAEQTERQQLQITQAGGYANPADAAAHAEREQKITEREQAINTVKQQAKDIEDVIQIAEETTVEDIQQMSDRLSAKETETYDNRKQMFQATAARSGTTAAKEEGIRRIDQLDKEKNSAFIIGRTRQHTAAGSVTHMTKIVKRIPSL